MGKIEKQVNAKKENIDKLTSDYISELKWCIKQLDDAIGELVEMRNAVFTATAAKIKEIGDKMEGLA